MWPTDDASISNGLRRKRGFLLVIAMMEMNERCWLRLGSSTFWATEGGKSSGWQGWYSMELPPRNLLRPWPSFTETHSWSFISAFLYRHGHHSTSITNLTNRTLRDIILLFDFVSTFVLLQVNFYLHGTAVFYDPCSLSSIASIWFPLGFVIAI